MRWWKELTGATHPPRPRAPATPTDDPAAILFSGGTTGMPKGIVLSHRNFIARGHAGRGLGRHGRGAIRSSPSCRSSTASVSASASTRRSWPAPSRSWCRSSRPRSSRSCCARSGRRCWSACRRCTTRWRGTRRSRRPTCPACAPCFSGADTLPRPVKERFEAWSRARGGNVKLLEGYGLTEAVTAIMAHAARPSIAKAASASRSPTCIATICRTGTTEELPPGEEGEICVAGPGGDARLPRRSRRRPPRRCECTPTAAPGCTPATSAGVTRTASSTSRCAPSG